MAYDPNRPDYPSNNVGQDVDQIRINCNALREHERRPDPPANPVIGMIWRTDNLPSIGYIADSYYMYNKNSQWIFLFSDNNLPIYESKFQEGSNIYAQDSGTINAYVIALSPVPTQYVAGMTIRFKASNTNTGASTLNVNSLGAKTIKKYTLGILGDLVAGDITAGQIIVVMYDGIYFQSIPVDTLVTTLQIANAAVTSAKLKILTGSLAVAGGSIDVHFAVHRYAFASPEAQTQSGSSGNLVHLTLGMKDRPYGPNYRQWHISTSPGAGNNWTIVWDYIATS